MTADVLRLVATDAASGPHDLADVARLLHAHAMPAAAWRIEAAVEQLIDLENNDYVLDDFEAIETAHTRYLESARKVADVKILVKALGEILDDD